MPADDQAAQEARAKRLRKQIDQLVAPGEKPEEKEAAAHPENPRDFVHRKMREIQQKQAGKSDEE